MHSVVAWARSPIPRCANLESRLASEEFQAIERLNHLPGRRLTTARTIAAEEEILRRVREAQNRIQPVTSNVEAFRIAKDHPRLNRAQNMVIEDVLSSTDRIQGIQGHAGAGKTTALTVRRG